MEHTKLTKKLLSEGWTKEQTPEGLLPWNDFYGGWQYKRSTYQKFVFQAPCGLLVKGDKIISDMCYMGIHWMVENDNPVINCPYYGLRDCSCRHPLLQRKQLYTFISRIGNYKHCAVFRTDSLWKYENSVEKVLDENTREEDVLWEIFAKKHHGRVCRHQAYFNRSEKKWHMCYDPMTCSHYGCSYCTLLDKPISAKRANVYYDLKKSFNQKGQGFMPDEIIVTITKGIKLLRASETICDAIVKCCKNDIEDTVRLNNHSFCFFGGTIEVQNLRYEHRESRDLLQDLEDVAAGITVIHESDRKKAEKKTKQERRAAAQQRRKNRFRKLIQTNGFLGLSASDQNRAKKHLSEAEIQEANRLHEISLLPSPDMQMSMEGCL